MVGLRIKWILVAVYSKTCVKDLKLVFKTNCPLMQVKSIAECSKGSILQYFRSSLSYHLSPRSLLCLFVSGSFIQVLLYTDRLKQIDSYLNMFYSDTS